MLTNEECTRIAELDVLKSEVKIEDLEHENIEIIVTYPGGNACLTGRVSCYDTFVWVGHGSNGLTLPLGTILHRIGVAGRSDYSEGYKFHVRSTCDR